MVYALGTFGRDDLERIVFYELSTRLLFYIAQSVISDDRLRRSLSVEDPPVKKYHLPILFLPLKKETDGCTQ